MNQHVRDNLAAIWKGTTNGDMDYYTSANAKARLGIGSANQVLTVAGGVPAWSGPIGGVVQRFTLGVQSIPNSTVTLASGFDSVQYLNGINFISYYFTIPANRDGLYYIEVSGYWSAHNSPATNREIGIQIDGTVRRAVSGSQTQAGDSVWQSCSLVRPLVAGAAITMYMNQKSGASLNFNQANLTVLMVR
jgi:hypothetical protein